MAEILVKAADTPGVVHPLRWLRGQAVVVMEDGHAWGAEERLPKFVVLKVPGVPVLRLEKYLSQRVAGEELAVEPPRRRVWQVQLQTLPLAARQKLQTEGELTILVPAFGYAGAFDYTWAQVKAFFLNTVTALAETEDP